MKITFLEKAKQEEEMVQQEALNLFVLAHAAQHFCTHAPIPQAVPPIITAHAGNASFSLWAQQLVQIGELPLSAQAQAKETALEVENYFAQSYLAAQGVKPAF